MARLLFLVLCGLVLTSCGVASAQGSLDATQTAIAQQSAQLDQTHAALDIGVTQTALVDERATLQARLTTPTPSMFTPVAATPGGINLVMTTATPTAFMILPTMQGGINLVTPASHPIFVFVRGEDGLLYFKVYQNGNWTDWKSLQPPSVGITTDSPSVIAQDDSRLDLFVRGQDGAAWHIVYDGARWSNWESLGGKLTSGPSAVMGR